MGTETGVHIVLNKADLEEVFHFLIKKLSSEKPLNIKKMVRFLKNRENSICELYQYNCSYPYIVSNEETVEDLDLQEFYETFYLKGMIIE
jgi:hypothetical protein